MWNPIKFELKTAFLELQIERQDWGNGKWHVRMVPRRGLARTGEKTWQLAISSR